MSTPSNPYRGFRYPPEIINQAVWLYHCFSLSLREVELILAARGIVVSYETIREWGQRFGRTYANSLKRRRPRPADRDQETNGFWMRCSFAFRANCTTSGEPLISMGTCVMFWCKAVGTGKRPSASFASC